MLAVTTFKPESFEQYAKNCVESLKKFFPGRIVVYLEEPLDLDGVEKRDFFKIPGVVEYLERLKRHPGADGASSGGYDYRYNANAFCRKVFVQDAAFDEDEYVFWFDADTVVLEAIPLEFLETFKAPFTYLGRENTYTETGFLGFNTKHPDFQRFRDNYLSYFTSGKIFSQLKGWHDCIAFDHARQGIKGHNLTPNGRGYSNVIGESAVGKYVRHLKGRRKFR